MKATYIDYNETNSFSSTALRYLAQDSRLEPFVSYFPTIENFGKLIAEKKVTADRKALHDVVFHQYAETLSTSALHEKVNDNIKLLLEDSTYTVTTGHQLNIFTGPLYFIYKIVTAINLATELKEKYPEKNFVPIYWMASEDHDFAEINNVNLFGTKISWDAQVSGATGRLDPQTIEEALRTYQNSLGLSKNSDRLASILKAAYLEQRTLAAATRFLVNALFQEYGVVVVDADEPALKRQFRDIVEEDILAKKSFRAINDASAKLKEAGFDPQVNSRDINFFYMKDDLRERIVEDKGTFYVLNTDIQFTYEELRLEIRSFPERFSPNVVMRPLYQEVILPNIAYIGGGAELVYWLQLKQNFDQFGINFPIILLRNSATLTDESFSSKLCRLHLQAKEIFKDAETLKKEWVLKNSRHSLSLQEEISEFQALFEKLKLRACKIDPTLLPSTDAVKARLKHALLNLEKKLIKAEKRNHEGTLQQIDGLKAKYFPSGGLQERTENFGIYFVKYGDTLISELVRHFKPLDSKFTILEP
ncbi:bacillithiol biosynthesis cysteine-adding enzyme BshC [Arcticibacter pallidicorallinus]|uniref:Putative cysteine ligase BshC n=1 Tax=Arcticibacter pallidicorallinus TaxID=1259464 RepID=A0A2T0U0K8_9SPHI|nr:bacillithiol biosynthesis cysteine-adding enzyme BshC [Arcticibacter pallidicorallinus]PRY51441.1 bacillithiol biosynthesis cysteine-adding enzyme BshC [Arcticibacter pallidicorallinus]